MYPLWKCRFSVEGQFTGFASATESQWCTVFLHSNTGGSDSPQAKHCQVAKKALVLSATVFPTPLLPVGQKTFICEGLEHFSLENHCESSFLITCDWPYKHERNATFI